MSKIQCILLLFYACVDVPWAQGSYHLTEWRVSDIRYTGWSQTQNTTHVCISIRHRIWWFFYKSVPTLRPGEWNKDKACHKKWIYFSHVFVWIAENGILSQLKGLVHCTNVGQETIKDLLAWVLRVSSWVQYHPGGSLSWIKWNIGVTVCDQNK